MSVYLLNDIKMGENYEEECYVPRSCYVFRVCVFLLALCVLSVQVAPNALITTHQELLPPVIMSSWFLFPSSNPIIPSAVYLCHCFVGGLFDVSLCLVLGGGEAP